MQDRLARLENRLPILFLTGYGDILTSVQAIKADAEDFLTQPVPKEKLLAAIKHPIVRCEELRTQDGHIGSLRSFISRLTLRESSTSSRCWFAASRISI